MEEPDFNLRARIAQPKVEKGLTCMVGGAVGGWRSSEVRLFVWLLGRAALS